MRGLAADCLHPWLVTGKKHFPVPQDTPDVPAVYGVFSCQLPGSGPSFQAGALPDELAAQIVKDQSSFIRAKCQI